MDDYVLYVSGRDFPPDAQSSLADKRKTARLCHVEHDEEETYQLTWSLRAAPTIQYIPRRMVTYAIKSMLETAVECCPVQIFLILDDLYNDNWFIELVAFLVYATNIDYQRPIVVHLVQGQNGDTNIDTSELEAMLSAPVKLELERAIPAPWCWYGDLTIPGGHPGLFTMVLQSEDPISSDLYASVKSRHPIQFVDIVNGGEKCDLTLDQLQEKPINVLLPGNITHAMRKVLNGGLMLLRLPGNFTSSNYALYESNRQWVMRRIARPARHEPIPDECLLPSDYTLPTISAANLSMAMFDDDFDFKSLTTPAHVESPRFSPVDVDRALKLVKPMPTTPKVEKRCRLGSDISFFSPSRIVAAKIQILDNLDDVRTERHNKMVRSNTRPKIKSPIRPGPSRALCLINKPRTRGQTQSKEPSPVKRIMSRNQEKQSELFPERLNETVSIASAKPVKKPVKINRLSTRRQSLTAKQTEQKTQAKRTRTGEVLRQTKLTDRRHSIAVNNVTSTSTAQRNLTQRSMSSISAASATSNVSSIRSTTSSCDKVPTTPKNDPNNANKMTGSEKKARLLIIVRSELEAQGMDNSNVNYKRCIKKLHEMCRMMLKGVTTTDKLIPLMESAARANAPLVISSINSE